MLSSGKEVRQSMKRSKTILAVITVMVMMVAAFATPAVADNWGNNWNNQDNNWGNSWNNNHNNWGNQSCGWYWSYWQGWRQWCWSPYWGWYQTW